MHNSSTQILHILTFFLHILCLSDLVALGKIHTFAATWFSLFYFFLHWSFWWGRRWRWRWRGSKVQNLHHILNIIWQKFWAKEKSGPHVEGGETYSKDHYDFTRFMSHFLRSTFSKWICRHSPEMEELNLSDVLSDGVPAKSTISTTSITDFTSTVPFN